MWRQENIINCMRKKLKKVKVKLPLWLTNLALRHEGVWGSGCIDPHFIDLGTSWRWVVSFMSRPLYPRERASVPIVWKVGWTPEPVWTTCKSENFWPYRGSNSGPARSHSLYRLRKVTLINFYIYGFVSWWREECDSLLNGHCRDIRL
jgi:hypothetical protein